MRRPGGEWRPGGRPPVRIFDGLRGGLAGGGGSLLLVDGFDGLRGGAGGGGGLLGSLVIRAPLLRGELDGPKDHFAT